MSLNCFGIRLLRFLKITQQPAYQAARNYWKVLKNRLNKEGSESVTKCNRLKMEAADGKKYLTDVADPETLLRFIQSVPSPKAEPIKLWLAKVGYERMQDMADPARSIDRAREFWQQHWRGIGVIHRTNIGINKHEGEDIGLYDTVLSSDDYQATFENVAKLTN
jgi:DNA-damage-inducible protein D